VPASSVSITEKRSPAHPSAPTIVWANFICSRNAAT